MGPEYRGRHAAGPSDSGQPLDSSDFSLSNPPPNVDGGMYSGKSAVPTFQATQEFPSAKSYSTNKSAPAASMSNSIPPGKKPKKQKPKRSKGSKVLLTIGILFLLAAIVCGYFLLRGYVEARLEYRSIRNSVGIESDFFDDIFAGTKDLLDLDIDWDALHELNPDIIGWIRVENTNINYPLCQYSDNSYYLSHNANGSYSTSGAIFLDYENKDDMSSDVNYIFGHNMLDGSMFANITKFKDQDFLNQNNRIIIVTPHHAWILGCAFTYIVDGNENIRKTEFDTDEELQEYISDLLNNRAVTSSLVDIDEITQLFCLVTCSYERNNVRTVLCAVSQRAVTYE